MRIKNPIVLLTIMAFASCQKGGEKFPPGMYTLSVYGGSYEFENQTYTADGGDLTFEVIESTEKEIVLSNLYSSQIETLYVDKKDVSGVLFPDEPGSFAMQITEGKIERLSGDWAIQGKVDYETIHTYTNPLSTDVIVQAHGLCMFKKQ